MLYFVAKRSLSTGSLLQLVILDKVITVIKRYIKSPLLASRLHLFKMSENHQPDFENGLTAASLISEQSPLLASATTSIPSHEQEEVGTEHVERETSTLATCILIICVTCATCISSLLAGAIIVAIPSIANDLELSRSVILWYVF